MSSYVWAVNVFTVTLLHMQCSGCGLNSCHNNTTDRVADACNGGQAKVLISVLQELRPCCQLPLVLQLCDYESIDEGTLCKGVSLLLSSGSEIDQKDANSITPLMMAVSQIKPVLVECMIRNGADVNLRNDQGDTAVSILLIFALNTGGRDKPHTTLTSDQRLILKHLLAARCDVNINNRYHVSPLIYCCLFGFYEAAELLLSAGADIDAVDPSGFTPMMTCINSAQLNLLQLLLTRGANLYKVSALTHGVSVDAMLLACRLGKKDMVLSMLENGYFPDTVVGGRSTPLLEAIFFCHYDVVQLLVTHGAGVNFLSGEGMFSPLVAACLVGWMEAAELLVFYGADINSQSQKGYSPLKGAVCSQNVAFVKFILNVKGCAINLQGGEEGSSALHLACHREPGDVCSSIVEMLLSGGASVDAQNSAGSTALMVAAGQGNVPVISLLLQAGANLDLKDNNGRDALSIATGSSAKTVLSKV